MSMQKDAARWSSEGGADPSGPATEFPAQQAGDIPEPPGTPDQVDEPPLAQAQSPLLGDNLAAHETAPEEIGGNGSARIHMKNRTPITPPEER